MILFYIFTVCKLQNEWIVDIDDEIMCNREKVVNRKRQAVLRYNKGETRRGGRYNNNGSKTSGR